MDSHRPSRLHPGDPTARRVGDTLWSEHVVEFLVKSAGSDPALVADIGCGYGAYTRAMAEAFPGATVVGVDIDPALVRESSSFSTPAPAHAFLVARATHLPFRDGTVDLILCSEVLEHVEDDEAALREMSRALRVDGKVVVTVPSRLFPFETHRLKIGRWTTPTWIPLSPWLPESVRARIQTARVYSPKRLRALVQKAGLTPLRVEYFLPTFDIVPDAGLRAALRTTFGRLERRGWKWLLAPHIAMTATRSEEDGRPPA